MSLYQLISVLADNIFIIIADNAEHRIFQASNKYVIPVDLYQYAVHSVSASFLGNDYNNVALYVIINR